jgi:hypothetical protein
MYVMKNNRNEPARKRLFLLCKSGMQLFDLLKIISNIQ